MLWQLKRLSTGEALSEKQHLPDNWGPIFGLRGIVDRIGDLSWLGQAYADQGWLEVEEEPPKPLTEEEALSTIEQMLKSTAWSVALDDNTITKGERAEWIVFRQALRNIPLQPGFPTNIVWPSEPVKL
jgi:hypothetical protein